MEPGRATLCPDTLSLRPRQLPLPPEGATGWPWTQETPAGAQLLPGGGAWPKISIVTPSFNQGQYLEETIRSVLLQNYPNLEYIVIDGGSTDGSLAILERYAPFLSYWVSEPDSGQSEAINKGLARCTGEIFNWLCSDDYLEPGALFEVALRMEAAAAEVVCGGCRLLYADGSVDFAKTPLLDRAEEMIFAEHICQPATFFRLSAVRRLGELSGSLHYCMDAAWWVRYLLLNGKGRIVLSDVLLVNYRFHEASKTVSRREHFLEEFEAISRAVLELLGSPSFVSAYYRRKPGVPVELLRAGESLHPSIHRRKLLAFYTRKSIKASFVRREFGSLMLNIAYDLYLKRLSFLCWGKDLRLVLPGSPGRAGAI